MRWLVIAIIALPFASVAQPQRLTLAEAEAIAVRNHPAIATGNLDALAAHERIGQAQSARFPLVTANITAVGAPDNSRIGAGGLNNPIIYSRFAGGFNVSQMLVDFGRTSSLIGSTRYAAAAGDQRAEAIRDEAVLNVRRAYFNAQRAESVLRVTKVTVDARQVVVDQVTELVKTQLKSSLDQSFAETSLAEAKLLVASAENERQAAYADLNLALGRSSNEIVELVEEPDPVVEPLALSELQKQALGQRPELKAARLDADAARQFAGAERALRYPAVSAAASAGYIPQAVSSLSSDYAAIGLNISLPFLNGGLYKAREAEAALRSRAAVSRVTDLENRIARDVARAWLDANTASERIRLTRQFVTQAEQALELAQTRYDLGLSSIVELSQAQLTKTSADIQYATARYDYQLRRAVLEYQSGGF